ncbi:MAG: hypothetical protein ACKPKO_58090, partial [Candidatus Fonsibacter sp.]
VGIAALKPRWMTYMSPYLARANASTIHYIPAQGLRLTMTERLRLQGLPLHIHKSCHGHVSDRQLGE